jgi:DNA/RNA-binding domain of Phe-tRNA-synthetase-like protein
MHFEHSSEIWRDFPELVACVLFVDGITHDLKVEKRVAELGAIAESRLAGSSESELPEVQAWRRAFSLMGLKPTQYRSASESLLRRFRKEGSLPEIHPLVDLCNAVSLAFAIPVAAFDVERIAEHIEVRYANGNETYETFSGDVEHPSEGEVVFVDAARRVHARRWTNRQSGYSAVRAETRSVLVVAEALHADARADVERLLATLAAELGEPKRAVLNPAAPRFAF